MKIYSVGNMSDMEKIKKARKHIDRIDAALIAILAERMSLMPEIAEYKKANKIPITDEKREIEIMKKLKKIGKEYGLEEGFVEEVIKPDLSNDGWIEQALRVPASVQLLVPSLDLRDAASALTWNSTFAYRLTQMGFPNVRVKNF